MESETKKKLLEAFRTILDIVEEHDCHISPEDGCSWCEDIFYLKEAFRRLLDNIT